MNGSALQYNLSKCTFYTGFIKKFILNTIRNKHDRFSFIFIHWGSDEGGGLRYEKTTAT